MCVLHKSNPYGTILLKQKDKQKDSKFLNFAYKFAKMLPIPVNDLTSAIEELVEENVLQLNGDKLIQKRMVQDNELSIIRANAGSKGGKNTQKFAKAKVKANAENENEDETEDKNGDLGEVKNENIKLLKGEIYLESICMKKSTDMETVLGILNEFIIDQDLCDGLNRPIEDIKSHFINTLNQKLKDRPKMKSLEEWLEGNKETPERIKQYEAYKKRILNESKGKN